MELYTFDTPNGRKIPIALEELGVPYNLHMVDISKGEQQNPDFLAINPNGKIPAMIDGDLKIFESVAILIYLAEKYGRLMPSDQKNRFATIEWAIFQAAGLGPMAGQLGHFKKFAKEKIPYAIDRYAKETDRLLGVMNGQLATRRYLACDDYTIADITNWTWVNAVFENYADVLNIPAVPHVKRWHDEIAARPAVIRGLKATKPQ